MFMPETEDMLPRAAPRPCAAVPLGHVNEIVKPTVPEVSILFGEPPQQQQTQMQQQQQQQQSASAQRPLSNFATWKKQILPRVNFSPVLVTELGPGSPPATSSAGNDYNYLPRTRFNEDRTTPPRNMNLGYAAPAPYATDHLVSTQRLANPSEVLTICASTQTETDCIGRDANLDLSNLAEKKDIREVLALLEMMRQEQQQLRRLCESLTQRQEKQQQLPTPSSKTYKETASQCDLWTPSTKSNATVKRITPIVQDYIVEEEDEELPVATYELPTRMTPKFQSPLAAPPMAQSTGYRPHTPKAKPAPAVLPMPSTEQSMVMNELALKYLPQRQIHELMDELHVSPKATATTPLRPIDNFVPSPSNMSNASYKYLKKYRLLPEEQLGYEHHQSPQGMPKMPQQNVCQEQMLDLDNIRNQPKLI